MNSLGMFRNSNTGVVPTDRELELKVFGPPRNCRSLGELPRVVRGGIELSFSSAHFGCNCGRCKPS
jgi:hypothetical protein